jgi:hypothetical protein
MIVRIFLALTLTLALAVCLALPASSTAAPAEKRRVEVVFVLDTTGSMGGLIAGAKKKIWSIANTIIDANPGASVRFGLVGYRDLKDEYVTKLFPLTDDAQDIYASLLAFQAGGGGDSPESVNEALDVAVTRAGWSDSRQVKADRILFLVGDAPPHMDYPQDRKYPEVIAEAAGRGIIVNTVQAGDYQSTEKIWREMASLGGGQYHAIPQDGGRVIVIKTPYDQEISRIQIELNKTVIPYGSKAQQRSVADKTEMYSAAPAEASAEMSRYVNKSASGKAVVTGAGDLTADLAAPEASVSLESLKVEELPEILQPMKPEERRAYVTEQTEKREALSKELAEQNRLRDAYVAQERAKAPKEAADSFDASVSATLQEQMNR